MWSLIVGFLLPLAIAFIQQAHWPKGLRAIVAFIVCLAAAVGTVYLQGPGVFTWSRWVSSALLTFVTAIATYKRFWKPTGIASAIEASTPIPPRGR